MQVHFFEEYPSDSELQLAQHIDFPCTIFLGAQSMVAFAEASARLERWNREIEPAYWPILPRSYWISPFSHGDELEQLRLDLGQWSESRPLKVLLDLELPLLQKQLFWRNGRHFLTNKQRIKSLFQDALEAPVALYTAEYPVPYQWTEWLQEALGIAYPMATFPHTKVAMFYSSLSPQWKYAEWLGERMLRRTKEYGSHFVVGVGTIATGAFGTEPILTPEALRRDLTFLQQWGVEEVVIFRLGGLSEAYLKVIRGFVSVP